MYKLKKLVTKHFVLHYQFISINFRIFKFILITKPPNSFYHAKHRMYYHISLRKLQRAVILLNRLKLLQLFLKSISI